MGMEFPRVQFWASSLFTPFWRWIVFAPLSVLSTFQTIREFIFSPELQEQATLRFGDWAWEWYVIAILLFLLIFGLESAYIKFKNVNDKFIPKVKVSDPFPDIDPKGAKGKASREWRLKIINDSAETIRNCFVTQKSLINKNGHDSGSNSSRFKLSRESPTIIPSFEHTQSFDITPGGNEIISIAGLHETDDNAGVIMLYAPRGKAGEQTKNYIPKEFFPHELTIQICAENLHIPEEVTYNLYINDSGMLIMDKKTNGNR